MFKKMGLRILHVRLLKPQERNVGCALRQRRRMPEKSTDVPSQPGDAAIACTNQHDPLWILRHVGYWPACNVPPANDTSIGCYGFDCAYP